MEITDYATFFDYHCQNFPAIRAWMKKEGEIDDVKASWFRAVFKDLDFETCKQVSDKMLAGDIDPPTGYSKHPAAFKEHCNRLSWQKSTSPEFIDGQRVYGCNLCEQSGYVAIVAPVTMKAMMDGERPKHIDCVVCTCTCSIGKRRTKKGGQLFAPELKLNQEVDMWISGSRESIRMPVIRHTGQSIDQLIDEYDNWKPENYSEVLAIFNSQDNNE